MSKYMGRDYLSIIWKDSETWSRIEIGRLSKNGCYEFIYIENNLAKAKSKGFEALVAFPDFEKCYENNEVFPVFSSRLPDKRRKDIAIILDKYGLENYDAFELLRRSGGKLPTDSLEFIDPIFFDSKKNIVREFYVAGTRYCDLCKKDTYPECILKSDLTCGEKLNVVSESENEHDNNAVSLYKISDKKEKIGYIPAYYAESVSTAITNGQIVSCEVKSFTRDNCQECVKVILEIDKE